MININAIIGLVILAALNLPAASAAPRSAAPRPDVREQLAALPLWRSQPSARTAYDWLLEPGRSRAAVYRTPDGKGLVLANGMVAREFRVVPALATTALLNRMTGESMLRAVSGEGTLWLDGRPYALGGLEGQHERGYLLPAWLDSLRPVRGAFRLAGLEVGELTGQMPWRRMRWALNTTDPTGAQVTFQLRGTGAAQGVSVKVRVALYDHLPAFRKDIEIVNGTARADGGQFSPGGPRDGRG